MGRNAINLTGRRFGRLTVIKRINYPGAKQAYWLCRCDCGNERIVSRSSLVRSHVQSCGCLIRDAAVLRESKRNPSRKLTRKPNSIPKVTHKPIPKAVSKTVPQSKTVPKNRPPQTRLYRIWAAMKQRCYNPKRTRFEYYGGRGITVCSEWKNSFKAFENWALTNGYRDNLSIDRIDVNGNYEPSNCRWATNSEQSKNRRPLKKGGAA